MDKLSIMAENIAKEPSASYGESYTYADYLTWQVKERFEILKGRLFKMSPAPNRRHQKISRELTRNFFKTFKKYSPCEVYIAPFDVRLPGKSEKDEDVETVFQPDLCVICNEEKLDDKGCIGAPDLIVEILSPGNSSKEMKHKFEIYEEAGVREYWIVNPQEELILCYVLKNGIFVGLRPQIVGDTFQSQIFPELSFPVNEIFDKS